MHPVFRSGLAVVTSVVFTVAGCGDDDDDPATHTGGSSAGGAASGGKAGGGNTSAGGNASGGSNGGSSGAAGESGSAECEVLGTLCHDADTGDGPAHDCHQVGHVGDVAVCKERFVSCIGICVKGEGGGAGGAGSGGASGETDLGAAYCSALGQLCHAVDDTDGPLHECHELGHVGDGAVCAQRFNGCANACLEARDSIGHGNGGAGAGGASGSGAGAASGGPGDGTAGASGGAAGQGS